MVSNETLSTFYINHNDEYDYWAHRLTNDGKIPVDGPDFDISPLTYIVKFPEELSHLLEDEHVLDYLFGRITNFGYAQNPFSVTGFVLDEDGERRTISTNDDKPYEHISINLETNSLEFSFDSFYSANNIEPYFDQNVTGEWYLNTLSFNAPILVPDDRMLDNGTYTFKTAIVEGKSVDLDQVNNAYPIDLVIDYSTDPEPEPEPEVDKAALEALVEEAKGYDKEDYTEDSYQALVEVLSASEDVLADEDATQEEVDAQVAALEAAIENLEVIETEEPEEPEVDKGALAALVEEAKGYDKEDYTEDSYQALVDVLSASEDVLADEDATQEEVDAQVTALETAIANLEAAETKEPEKPTDPEGPEPTPEPETVDKSRLQALINEAKAYQGSDYTDQSYAKFKEALTKAQKVLADEEASKALVDQVVQELQEAIDQLELIEADESEGSGERLPDTATNYYSLMMIGSLLAIAGGITHMIRRRIT